MSGCFRFAFFLGAALWLGGGVIIAVSAPLPFQQLPSRDLAGPLVGAMIARYHWVAYGSGLLMLLGTAVPAALRGWSRLASAQLGLVAFALAVSLYSGFAVSGRMAEIRAELGSIEQTEKSHPLRQEFDALHRRSVNLMGIHLLAVAAAMALAVRSGD